MGMLTQAQGTGFSTVSVNINAYTVVGNGKTTVTTPGTAVQVASTTAIGSITVKALASNAGKIYVGTSSVSSSNGFQLAAGDSVSLDINDPSKVWLDADNAGEGVTYIYLD